MRMIVLAAGQGSRMRPLTDECPKTLVPFMGRPILDWALAAARENGLAEPVVVAGHRWDRLAGVQAHVLRNPEYASTGIVGSLMVAEEWFGEGFVMSYGDIVFRPEVLRTVRVAGREASHERDAPLHEFGQRLELGPAEGFEEVALDSGEVPRSSLVEPRPPPICQ